MKSYKILGGLLLASFIAVAGNGTWGCGTATRGTTDGDTTDSGDDSGTASSNALAVAYPDDLAVTSITASTSSSSSLRSALGIKSQATEFIRPQDFAEKKEEFRTLLTAEAPADLQIVVDFTKQAPSIGCYGPVLYLNQSGGTGHPNGTINGMPPNNSQQLPPFDLGIWEEEEDGEACIAAQVNKLMGDIENYLNIGLKGAAASLAAGNIAGLGLPEQGEMQDLTEAATDAFNEGSVPMEPTLVEITREAADTSEGFPVFVTQLEATIDQPAALKMKNQEAPGAPQSIEMTLEHIPEVELPAGETTIPEDSTYCGRFQQKVNFDTAGNFGQNFNGCTGTTECISISYCKESETSLTYHVRRATFCGQDADCFNADGDVDLTNSRGQGESAGWAGNAFYIIANVNPEDGSGDFAQAWQAGTGDGNTRTFNVSVDADGNGCGFFGFGPDIAATSGVGEIDGMVCNWTGPGSEPIGQKTSATLLAKAQRQCFTRNETSGEFESIGETDDDGDSVDESLAITFAPTNSCDKGANSFAYGIQDPPTDVPAATAITNDLINVADVDFTVPTLPVVP